jgi:ABC-type Fe3+-hydroxamate transport system substrate-binding protein
MREFKDQLRNKITLAEKPRRIISLVPSQSEFLWDIGLREELVGITKFCIHPDEMFRTVDRVGGTKQLNVKKIRSLRPDLIIGNKEENEESQIKELQKEFPVWMSDIVSLDDAFEMMSALGDLIGRSVEATGIIQSLRQSLPGIQNIFSGQSVAYFIWNDPYMLAANNTFINYILNYIGFKNAADQLNRYPKLTDEELQKMNPEFCFLSSEPFPFKEKHVRELQKKIPHSKIIIVDGEIFSWYGSRLRYLEAYIKKLRPIL